VNVFDSVGGCRSGSGPSRPSRDTLTWPVDTRDLRADVARAELP
jgi:hypothetical protein